MSTYIICLAKDLSKDAERYANGNHYTLTKNLNKVKDNDAVIIYTHGVWYKCAKHGNIKASNEIQYGEDYINAKTAANALQEDLGLTQVANLKIIVHACFSAGTVETPPKANDENIATTFAKLLCDELHWPGLVVLGYQGATKAGLAGYAYDQDKHPISERGSRRKIDPRVDGYTVSYSIDEESNLTILAGQGANVVWRPRDN